MSLTNNKNRSDTFSEKYSLWLKPENEVHDVMKRIIDSLSGQYAAPRFEPHITVAGNITNPVDEIIKSMDKIAKSSRPMTLYLTDTDYMDSFYQALFVRVAPNDALLQLREQCLTELKQEHEPYMPHISLMYNNMDGAAKEQIIDQVGKRFDLVFIPDKLYLMRTSGLPDAWEEITNVSLIN